MGWSSPWQAFWIPRRSNPLCLCYEDWTTCSGEWLSSCWRERRDHKVPRALNLIWKTLFSLRRSFDQPHSRSLISSPHESNPPRFANAATSACPLLARIWHQLKPWRWIAYHQVPPSLCSTSLYQWRRLEGVRKGSECDESGTARVIDWASRWLYQSVELIVCEGIHYWRSLPRRDWVAVLNHSMSFLLFWIKRFRQSTFNLQVDSWFYQLHGFCY